MLISISYTCDDFHLWPKSFALTPRLYFALVMNWIFGRRHPRRPAVHSPDVHTRGELARSGDMDEQELWLLARDRYWHVRSCVLENKNITGAMLDELCRDIAPQIQYTAIANKATMAGTLAALVDHDDPNVRMLVASNPNTSVETLLQLLNDSHSGVRRKVLDNPACPDHMRTIGNL